MYFKLNKKQIDLTINPAKVSVDKNRYTSDKKVQVSG